MGEAVRDGRANDYASFNERSSHPTKLSGNAASPLRLLGGKMSGIMENVLDLIDSNREVIVWSNDGIIEGRARCNEREVGGYIRSMLKNSNGRLRVVIEQQK